MDLDKIEKLNELKEKGMLTEHEYARAKARLLGEPDGATCVAGTMDKHTFSMLLHFSQLCGYILPMLGWIMPLVLWLLKREDPYINRQGKVVFNWIISSFIYFLLCVVLLFVLVGYFLMIALAITSIIFIILGAVRAKEGVVKNYPMSIPFFNIEAASASEKP